MNIELWIPAITAALTLINTVLMFLNNRRLRNLHHKVNGMYLQSLAAAEDRGRGQAMSGGVVAMSVPRDTAPPPSARPLDRSPDDFDNKVGPSTS